MKVSLSFFQDDATGDYGLAHTNSLDKGFNAFWTAQGIFHDVFEHYFEENHKYFMGDAAFNLGGEVAAMGHLAYYVHLGLGGVRSFRGGHIDDSNIVSTTHSDMVEAMTEGYINFGSEFISGVPRQKTGTYHIENIIYEHWWQIQDAKKKKYTGDECSKEYAMRFKKSLTLGKLNNLYRWGFSTAEKMIPRTSENIEKLHDFFGIFKALVNANSAEDMTNIFKSIEFTITEGENFDWKAEIITKDNRKFDVLQIVNEGIECVYDIEDAWE